MIAISLKLICFLGFNRKANIRNKKRFVRLLCNQSIFSTLGSNQTKGKTPQKSSHRPISAQKIEISIKTRQISEFNIHLISSLRKI